MNIYMFEKRKGILIYFQLFFIFYFYYTTPSVSYASPLSVNPSLADKSASHFVFNGDEESENEGDDIDDQEEVLEEETDDFETAWEVLDLARVIYSKMDTPIGRARVADIHILLGDISLETGKTKIYSRRYKYRIQFRLLFCQDFSFMENISTTDLFILSIFLLTPFFFIFCSFLVK